MLTTLEKLVLAQQACFASEAARETLKRDIADLRAKLAKAERWNDRMATALEGIEGMLLTSESLSADEALEAVRAFRTEQEAGPSQAERERDAAMVANLIIDEHFKYLSWTPSGRDDFEVRLYKAYRQVHHDHPHLFTAATGKEDGEQ